MSENPESESGDSSRRGPFPRKGFRIFGLGLQDCIRYFFGGNAALAIVVLILICVFLAIEAFWFFPQHHHEFRLYRQSGQEFVDYVKTEVDAHTRLGSNLNIALLSEVNASSEREDQLINALLQVETAVETETRRLYEQLERSREAIDELLAEIEELDVEATNREELENQLAAARSDEGRLAPMWQQEVEAVLEQGRSWKLEGNAIRLTDEEKDQIRQAVLLSGPGLDPELPYFDELRQRSADLKAAARETHQEFKAAVTDLRAAVVPLRELQNELREVGMNNRRVLDKFETAPDRRKALLEGAAATVDPEEKARKLRMADEVIVEEPDYDALMVPIYASVPRHDALSDPFLATVEEAYGRMPDRSELSTEVAQEKVRAAERDYETLVSAVERSREKLPEWRHDKPLSLPKTVLAFFIGKEWVTNSSWHEFYGLLPLFFGSLVISIVAIVVAVPFAVSAAVYVNQLAGRKEQNFIKPALEFIQAIPSVVLGFFGILVLGTFLREWSQGQLEVDPDGLIAGIPVIREFFTFLCAALNWIAQFIPGFPMSERLNMLNAGLLLAFMAIPTIFTLAEDALNNVPGAFSEASFALGASRLQTIYKVVMPTAISGIIAAVLLGFGRIIGETMVVLLVAGNKIQIPDFTAGLGVVTQPAHTMTGIIAQELGEVDKGSLHWRALFMVGMVLFVISLSINFTAQRILKRFHETY